MASIMLRAFTSLDQATAFFKNAVVESGAVDGMLIKDAGQILMRKDAGGMQDLTGGTECYLVVSYNRGTGIQLDSGPPAAAPADQTGTGTGAGPG